MLLTLENQSALPRTLRCEWILPDSDGDQVRFSRTVTLTPQRTQQAWLYASIPLSSRGQPEWRVRVVDPIDESLVASAIVRPPSDLIPADTNLIGITASSLMGLEPYIDDTVQNEKIRFLTGLKPAELPDRWPGFNSLSALIWTPQGGDPGAADVSPETLQAIRDWVRRGGHLVIVLPSVGDMWSDSALKDILPPVTILPAQIMPKPMWIGLAKNPAEDPGKMMMRELKVLPGTSVLLKDTKDRPIVVAAPVGAGRVTMVGLDISDPRLAAVGLPQGNLLWNTIFGWQNPVLTSQFIQSEIQEGRLIAANQRSTAVVEISLFIPPLIAMRDNAGPWLLASIITFGVYWLVAGPLSFAVLHYQKKSRYNWLCFAIVVLFFSLLTWSAALAARPGRSRIEHVSTLAINANEGSVHIHSWLSVFVPTHGMVNIAIDPSAPGYNAQAISSPGLSKRDDPSSFIDPQWYLQDAANPARVLVPMRSTSKMFELDYQAKLTGKSGAGGKPWPLPQGKVELVDGWPRGELVHSFPGALEHVLIVFCPGTNFLDVSPKVPTVWRMNDPWKPGKPLQINDSKKGNSGWVEHVKKPEPQLPDAPPLSNPWWGGHLGELTRVVKPGAEIISAVDGDPVLQRDQMSKIVNLMELESFYSALPPPQYTKVDYINPPWSYQRSAGRAMDLSAMLNMRCVIVIGYLQNQAIPVPLEVDGVNSPSQGLTMVRWMCPLN